MKISNTVRLHVAAALMVLFWASAYIGIRLGLKGYTPGAMALFRYLVASFCMLIVYRMKVRYTPLQRIRWSDLIAVAILGILGFAIYNIALNYGELTVTAGITSFIVSQTPVLMSLFAIIFFRHRLTEWAGLGTVISFLGILLISVGEAKGLHWDWGVLYLLMATLCGSLYSLFQKPLLQRLHPVVFTAYAIWFGTLALMIYWPTLLHEIAHAPLKTTLAVVYNGIFPAAIAYLLWGLVLAELPAIKAASFLYLVPVVATLLGMVMLHEMPTWISLSGSVLALSGAILVNRHTAQEEPAKKEQTELS